MQSIKLFFSVALISILFNACQTNPVRTSLVEFDDVILRDTIMRIDTVILNDTVEFDTIKYAVSNGGDLKGKFISSNKWFKNSYDTISNTWTGFACTAQKDSITPGVVNLYSSVVGSGAFKTKKYALICGSATMICDSTIYGDYVMKNIYGNFSIKSMMITNSTYAYLDMKNGSSISKKFIAGDWFKLIMTGYLNNVQTGQVEYFLADFRNGKTFLSKTWNKVDVSTLGEVDKVEFTFDSSDKTGSKINTPTYACIDFIELTQPEIVK